MIKVSINDNPPPTDEVSRDATLRRIQYLHGYNIRGLSLAQLADSVSNGASVAAIHNAHPGSDTWKSAQHLCITVPDDPKDNLLVQRHAAFYQKTPDGYRIWYTLDREIKSRLDKWQLLAKSVAWTLSGEMACDQTGLVAGQRGKVVVLNNILTLQEAASEYVLPYQKRESRDDFSERISRVHPPLSRAQYEQVMSAYDNVVSRLVSSFDGWHLQILERYGIEPNDAIPLFGVKGGDIAFVYEDGQQIEIINMEGGEPTTDIACLSPIVSHEYEGYPVAVCGAVDALEAHKELGAAIIDNKLVRIYALSEGQISSELEEKLRQMVVIAFNSRPLPDVKGVRKVRFVHSPSLVDEPSFTGEIQWAMVS